MCNIRGFCSLRELYEADFHKPGIYGSARVWTNAWDVFRRAPSRGGRGRWAAVDFVVFLGGADFFVFIFVRFFLLRTHTACCKYEATLPYLPLYYSKTVVHAGCHYLISLSVYVCVTVVVFTDCESYTETISTNPGSMEAGECGRTRGICLIARRLEVVAVARLL